MTATGAAGGWCRFFLLPGLVSQFSSRLGDHDTYGLINLGAGLLYLWGGIEMYFLKGSRWINRFGPNPLAKTPSRPRSDHTSSRGVPGWNQENETNSVPHQGARRAAAR